MKKVISSRATKRVLEHHVDETGYPDTSEEQGEYARSKRLATIGAKTDKDWKKLDVKKNTDELVLLKWNNPQNEAKNRKKKNEEDDISTTYWTAGSPTYFMAYPDHYKKEN